MSSRESPGRSADRPDPDDGELRLPDALVEALRDLDREAPPVPPAVDAAILRGGRRHLRWLRGRTQRAWLLRIAALIVLGLGVWLWAPPAAGPHDINRDGRVDIRDAFLLSLAIERNERGARDVDGDGRADRADVEEIARAAVAIGGR